MGWIGTRAFLLFCKKILYLINIYFIVFCYSPTSIIITYWFNNQHDNSSLFLFFLCFPGFPFCSLFLQSLPFLLSQPIPILLIKLLSFLIRHLILIYPIEIPKSHPYLFLSIVSQLCLYWIS